MSQTPWHHWPVSILALLYALIAVADYVLTQFRIEQYLSAFTPAQIDYFTDMPLWVDAAWAVNVWTGLVAAIVLAQRGYWAAVWFAVSFVALAVASYGLIYTTEPRMLEITGPIGPALLGGALLVLALLFLYARRMHQNEMRG